MSADQVRDRTRALVALLVVVALAVPAIAMQREVRLAVDGAVTEVRTYASTVADVLVDAGVELAAGDRVLPAPDGPLPEGGVIRVLRSITVELDVDGTTRAIRGTYRTVGGLLAEVGIDRTDELVVTPSLRTTLDDGDRVEVRSPEVVAIVADGREVEVLTHLDTVGEVLRVHGVELGEFDVVTPPVDAPVAGTDRVVVERVTGSLEVDRVELPFESETRPSDEMFVGRTRVAVEGEPGERVDLYRLTFVDGELTERELVSREVVREPVTEVVEEGTVPRPTQDYIDDGSIWWDLARCESGQRWHLDIGRFDGGLQFLPSTWTRWKRPEYPKYAWLATPEQQIETAVRLQAAAGWGQWPACARKLGLL